MKIYKSYGLLIEPRDPLDFCYTLGASKIHKEVRREDGNWTKDLPDGEIQQRSGFESFSCVSFGTLNIAEILQWVKFGIRANYSDRFLSTMSETTNQGNDPKTVAGTFRHAGAVPEADWPFTNETDTFDKFHAPPPISVRNTGIQWLKNYEIGYEWVTPTPENLMEELRDTSDKVMYSRRTLIDLSADYNTKLVTFPSSIVANMFGFQAVKGFETPESGNVASVTVEELKTPKVTL